MGYRWQVRVYPSRADGKIGWTSCRPNTRRNVVYWGNDRRNVPWIEVVFRYTCFQLHDPETMIECMMFKMIFYLTPHIIPWCGIKCDSMYLIGNVTFSLFSDTSWVEEFPFFRWDMYPFRGEKPSNHCFLHSQRWPTNSAVESPLRLLSHSKSSESWIDPVGGTVVPFVEKQMLMMLMLKVYTVYILTLQETYVSHLGKRKTHLQTCQTVGDVLVRG